MSCTTLEMLSIWDRLSRQTVSDHAKPSNCPLDHLHIVQRLKDYGYISRMHHRNPA